jgi:hypothetical protein
MLLPPKRALIAQAHSSMPFITNATDAVQFVFAVGCLLAGLSHIVQPGMWVRYFSTLHAQGTDGVITRTFTLELWPALAIVALHQVWSGPGIVLTVYGWLLTVKCAISLLAPQIALRGMGMARRGERTFIGAGVFLCLIGLSAGAALFWPDA